MCMSWQLNDVVEVKPLGGHLLRIRFDDGLSGDLDLSAYIHRGPIFAPLADPAFFRRVEIRGGTIAWPNGADIAPERLYELLERTPA